MRSLAAAVLLLVGLAGCGPDHRNRPAVVHQTARPAPAPERPHAVNTRGLSGRWQERTEKGGIRRVMDVHAETGRLDAQTQSGTLYKANGLLYHDDRARARFEAPVVEARKDHSVVIARGGVRVVSIDPPGVTLTAERVTWQVDKDLIVAEGSVSFEQRPPGSARPTAWGGPFPHVTANTELQRLTIP